MSHIPGRFTTFIFLTVIQMNSWDLKPSNRKGLCSISKHSITGKAVFSFTIAAK